MNQEEMQQLQTLLEKARAILGGAETVYVGEKDSVFEIWGRSVYIYSGIDTEHRVVDGELVKTDFHVY
jgi:hypothetical protein